MDSTYVVVNGVAKLVTHVVANGHLIEITRDATSLGKAANTSDAVIDLTDAWPQQLTGVTG